MAAASTSNNIPPQRSTQAAEAVHNDHHPPGADAAGEGAKNESHQAVKARWTPYERSAVIIQILTFLALVAYTVVNFHMWKAMDAANDLARSNSEATKQIVAANKTLADTTAQSFEEGKRQFDIQRRGALGAADEERRRFDASFQQQQRNAAIEQGLTRQSLEESRRALEHAERARVGVIGIDELALNGPLPARLRVRLRNTGHMSAADLVVTEGLLVRKTDSAPDLERELSHVKLIRQSKAAVLSGADFESNIEFAPLFTEELKKAIQEGTWYLFAIGKVVYFDGFRQRKTTFCWYHDQLTGWRFCESGNIAE